MAAPMRARIVSWKIFCRHVHAKSKKTKPHAENLTRPVTEEELPMDPQVLSDYKSGKLKARKNPGVMRLKTIQLPERLEKAVNILTYKYGRSNLVKDSQKLAASLMTRQLPLEQSERIERKKAIRQKIINKDNVDLAAMSSTERQAYEAELDVKCEKELKYFVESHWKRRVYNAKDGMAYLLARLSQNYAVLLQVLNEIWRRDPDYIPRSLYNYGSGLGSVIWAVQNNKEWQKNISEYYCVDPSPDINTIARLLLQDGEEEGKMHIKGVFFRRNPRSSDTNKSSLVVSAYTLVEYESSQRRLELVKALWDMAEDYLVLVEMGSFAGHRLIQEAKDYILKISGEEESENKAFVFAPCPHQKSCPKFNLEQRTPCAFFVDYKPLEAVSKKDDKESEGYTFVILKKSKEQVKALQWPRIVDKTSRGSGHIHCRICCPTGDLDHIVITKKKHSPEMYAIARRLKLGDYLPAIYTQNSTKEKSARYQKNVAENESVLPEIEDKIAVFLAKQAKTLEIDSLDTLSPARDTADDNNESDTKNSDMESEQVIVKTSDQSFDDCDRKDSENHSTQHNDLGNVLT